MTGSKRHNRQVSPRLARLEEMMAMVTQAKATPDTPQISEEGLQELQHYLLARLEISEAAYIARFPDRYQKIERLLLPPTEALRRQTARRQAVADSHT